MYCIFYARRGFLLYQIIKVLERNLRNKNKQRKKKGIVNIRK